jgi:hypothetical protein
VLHLWWDIHEAQAWASPRSADDLLLEELTRRSIRGHVAPFNSALVYLGMGDRERALDYLERAYAVHSQWMAVLKMDRVFYPLRSEPRFMALMKRLNFEKWPRDGTMHASIYGSFTEGFDTADLKDAKRCSMIWLRNRDEKQNL